MNHEAFIPAPSPAETPDPWFEWLNHRRHGGDSSVAQLMEQSVANFRDRVLDGAKLAVGMTLLDVGTGEGVVGLGALERMGKSLKVIFSDVSPALLGRAEQAAGRMGLLDCCSFVQASAEKMEGVEDSAADVITTRSVLAYLQDKNAAAREFFRVLKPGGRISLAEPIFRDEALHLALLSEFLRERAEDASTLDARLYLRWRSAQLPATREDIHENPLTNFTERDLMATFERAGFIQSHLELHIDLHQPMPEVWDTFIDSAPRPNCPTLREILASRFSEAERKYFEQEFRPVVEEGLQNRREVMCYLTAIKPG